MNALTKIGPNAVRSSEGFTVAIAKRFELHHEDQHEKTIIPIEPMADGEIVATTSILPESNRRMISERISQAFDFLGIRYRFD